MILAILAIAGASGQESAQAQTYHLTDLGTINQGSGQIISHPAGINNAGQVTGYSYSGTSIHAARFTNGLVEDLGTIPGGSKSYGVGINDLGQVVGDSEYSVNGGSIRHAALFSNGTATDLGFLPGWGNYSRGNGINDSGVVVGHSGPDSDTNVTRAFIWDAANGMRDIGTLGGPYAKAFSINDSGLVTGEARTGTGGDTHAFIWSATTGMQDLGTIAGNFSSGSFINANGHVVGWSLISADNRRHAFLYDGTTMHDLGAIGSNHFFTDRSEAYGVNIHDVVVGTTYLPYQGGAAFQIAFVYRDGQMLDLETLVDESGANYRLYTATGINDAGQIAVDAIRIGSPNQIRAVLLTPNGMATPTPTATPTGTPGATPTPTTTPAPTTTPGATPTPTPTTTPTPAPTATPGVTATPSATPVATPTPTQTPAATPTPFATPTPTPALTATPGTTPIPTPAPTATPAASSTPTAAPTATPTPAAAQAINLSTRMRVQTGDGVGIGGFIITGSAPKRVLLRAIGPSLTQFGVPNVVADPMLELHGPATFVTVTNDNWRNDPAQQAQIQATGLAPTNSLESAIDATLAPGAYTAIVRGTGNTSGVALVEVYDLDQEASSKLDNISTRALISTGDNIVIAGFMVGGQSGSDRVVIRGIGPSLLNAGVPNALADPTLELRDGDGALLVANNDWQSDPLQASQLTSADLAPPNNLESGIVINLPPGRYTALLAGRNGGTGIGLVEVYDRVGP